MPAHALSLSHVSLDVQRRDTTGRRTGTLRVLENLSLRVRPGEALTIVGPAGSGKSALLDLLAGFARPSQGRVEINGREVTGPAPERGFVQPSYGLFPWRTALDNVTFSLDRALSDDERHQRASEALEFVGLGTVTNERASTLTPAQKQRLSLAKAIAPRPGVLLLDDPFANLPWDERQQLQHDLLRIQNSLGVALVCATSDIDEAVRIGTRVAVLSLLPGRIETTVVVDPARPQTSAHQVWLALQPQIAARAA